MWRHKGTVKRALCKSVGSANVTWNEFKVLRLDVEVALNNRPLMYLEEDIQLSTVTPNIMMFGQPNFLPEEDVDSIEETNLRNDLRKRVKYLRGCKDVLWRRWKWEYVKTLRPERHKLNHKNEENQIALIHNDKKNRGKLDIGVLVKVIKGREGIVRAATLRVRKTSYEWAVQQLRLLELSCERFRKQQVLVLSPISKVWTPLRGAVVAAERI